MIDREVCARTHTQTHYRECCAYFAIRLSNYLWKLEIAWYWYPMEDLNFKNFFSFFFSLSLMFTFLNKVKIKLFDLLLRHQILPSDWLVTSFSTFQRLKSDVSCLVPQSGSTPCKAVIISYWCHVEVCWICLYNWSRILSPYLSPSTLFLHRAIGNQLLSSSHNTLCQTLWRTSGD